MTPFRSWTSPLVWGSLLVVVGCFGDSSPTGREGALQLDLRAALSTTAGSLTRTRAVQYDSVVVIATDASGAVVGQVSTPVSAESATVDLALEVVLAQPVATVTVSIQVFAEGQVALAGAETFLVDSGAGVVQAPDIVLDFVAPVLALSPASLVFNSGGSNPSPQVLSITNAGAGSFDWTVSSTTSWLTTSPGSGSAPGSLPGPVVSVDVSGLAEGVHQATIMVDAPGALDGAQTVPVTLTIDLTPRIGTAPSALSFSAQEFQSPPAQTITVRNDGGGTLRWLATPGPQWLSIAPRTGTLGPGATAAVVVTPSTASMASGTYSGSIQFSASLASNTPLTVPVDLTITAAPRFTVTIDGQGTGSGTVTSSPPGIQCSINLGQASGPCVGQFVAGTQLTLSPSPTGGDLFNGWTGDCPASGLCQVVVDQDLRATAEFFKPPFGVSPRSIGFNVVQFTSASQQILVENNTSSSVTFTTSGGAFWSAINPSAGSLRAGEATLVDVIVSPDTLSPGFYQTTAFLESTGDPNNPVPVTLFMQVTSSGGGSDTTSTVHPAGTGAARARQEP